MIFDQWPCEDAAGVVLAHTLKLPNGVIKKGATLTVEDTKSMLEAGISSILGAKIESTDQDENFAAQSIAQSLAGPLLKVGKPMGGRCNLYARNKGVVQVDKARIDAINLCDGAIAVSTLPQYADAMAEQTVATVKIIPFAVPQTLVEHCVDIAQGDPKVSAAVQLNAYQQRRIGLILTHAPGLKSTVLDSTREVTRQRIKSMGCDLVWEKRCSHQMGDISNALGEALASDCDIVLISGATVTADVGDLVPTAILSNGGEIDQFGMPVEPGNMLLLAHIGRLTIINLPGCSRSPKLNGLDWVLQRLLADIAITPRDIRLMGVGGLIKDLPRVRRAKERLSESAVSHSIGGRVPAVAAVILAAGCSRRMGKQNKLLLEVEGVSMVEQIVATAQASDVEQVIVVTGHEAERIEQLLGNTDATLVQNPDYATGMASSLRTGLNAVADGIDGALILLADMPYVSSEQINELIAEFNPLIERDIVAPFKDGRRGNPVLWASRYFDEIKTLTGDIGARSLLQEYAANIWDVPVNSDEVFIDFDTPEDLTAISTNQTTALDGKASKGGTYEL